MVLGYCVGNDNKGKKIFVNTCDLVFLNKNCVLIFTSLEYWRPSGKA